MRLALALALLLPLAGCSLTDADDADSRVLAYRDDAQAGVGQAVPSVTVLRSRADVDAFRAEAGISTEVRADFERETVVALAPFGACPATNYSLEVTDATPDGDGILFDAEVRQSGDGGGAALTYPVTFVAVVGLPSVEVGDGVESRVLLRVADPTGDCTLG